MMLRLSSSLLILAPCALLTACGTTDASGSNEGPPVLIGQDTGDTGAADGEDTDPDSTSPPQDGGLPSLDVSTSPDASGNDGSSIDIGLPPADTNGGSCVPGTTRCEDDVLRQCSADGQEESRIRCASRGQICGVSADGRAACVDGDGPIDPVDPICIAGSRSCSSDGSSVQLCLDDGAGFSTVEVCTDGCDDGRCLEVIGPIASCDTRDVIELDGDSLTVDLCDEDNDDVITAQRSSAGECGTIRSPGRDAMVRLVVDEATTMTINLVDDDPNVAIDTVLSLRTTCDDVESQVACSDDVACASSSIQQGCSNGVQPRQSRLANLSLEAGEYYLVLDSIDRRAGATQFRCGTVRLTITRN